MNTKIIFSLLASVLAYGHIYSQGVGINPNGSSPDPSAMLDVSASDKGMLIPRLTTAERDAIDSPAYGLQIFNTETGCLNMWTGASWKRSCFDCDFTPPVAGNNGPICEGNTLNLTATYIPDAEYSWSGPNGFTSSLQNPTIENATSGASGAYALQVTLNGCTTSAITTSATVNSIPSAPVAGNSGAACLGDNINLTASNVAGASYTWTGPNGYSALAQNPVISNAALNQVGTYYVFATVNGCESNASSTEVSISTVPGTPGTVTGSASACFNSSGNAYSINAVNGATSYTWTAPAGSTVATGQGTVSAEINFGGTSGNVCVSSDNQCGSSSPSCITVTLQGGSGSQTFNYSGAIVNWEVPVCVYSIQIEAWGAQGGSGQATGGSGAYVRSNHSVTPGQTLKVLAGQKGFHEGGQCDGGGGGGSFVATSSNVPMVAAGGGGGGSRTNNGFDGLASETGGSGYTPPGESSLPAGSGGTNGNGGGGGYFSGGGGGFFGNGGTATGSASYGQGGLSFVNGATGGLGQNGNTGARGGFGGGGGGLNNCYGGGGGGGGYSGGGAGGHYGGGAGGGSFTSGTNPVINGGVRTGDGQVIITW